MKHEALKSRSHSKPLEDPVVAGWLTRNRPPFAFRRGKILLIYAFAASSGDILDPPEPVVPSGSLNVKRWVEFCGNVRACAVLASMLSMPCIWGKNRREGTRDEDAGYGLQFQYHERLDLAEVRRLQSERWSSPSMDTPRFEVAAKVRDVRLKGRRRKVDVESFIAKNL